MQHHSYWVQHLHLSPHPEGGYYKETYRAAQTIGANELPQHGGPRPYATGIYYLLAQGDFSAWHRIKSDEMWHFYAGGPLHIYVLTPQGQLEVHTLGPHLHQGQHLQLTVPAHYWFAAKPANQTPYTLAGCTVAPGFDFDDFEMANAQHLAQKYAQHQHIIKQLSH